MKIFRIAEMALMLGALAGTRSFAEGATNGPAAGQPLSPAAQAAAFKRAELAEQLRTKCVEGRRYVAGRVMEIRPEGLIVDSGYSVLLSPPYNQSWVAPGNITVARDPAAVEEKQPDAVCIGMVCLSSYPKRPAVKQYDYVVIHAYPAGDLSYQPVPGVQKTVRRYSASLENAVKAAVERSEK